MLYDMKKSGEAIRKIRVQNKYTQAELAEALGMDRSFLSCIESGKKGCSVDLLIQLSDFFRCHWITWFLGLNGITSLKKKN